MENDDPEDDGSPPMLDGYRGPIRIPNLEVRKQLLANALFPVVHVLLWPNLFVAYIQLVGENLRNVWLIMYYVDAQFILVFLGVTLVHEAVHYALSRQYGFDSDCGINRLGAYVVIPRQFIRRNEYLRMVGAPLLVLNLIAVLGVVLPLGNQISVVSKLVLLLNTSMASADILDFLLYRQQPIGAKFYNIPDGRAVETYVYPPAGAVDSEE